MSSPRSVRFRGVFRAAPLLLTAVLLAACSSATSTAPAPSAPPATASVVAPPSASVAASTAPSASVAASVVAASSAPSTAAGTGDCAAGMVGRQKFTMFGMEADKYCGPATATVTLAGATVSLSNGWCETNAAGFTLSMGTQLFGNPTQDQEPDLLLVLVNPTSGAGPISGVANHHNWLLNDQSVHFGAGNKSGTFAGTAIVGGAVSGSFSCGD